MKRLSALCIGLCATLALAGAGAAPASAEVSRADLAKVGVKAPSGAHLPLGLAFRDQDGQPLTLGQALDGRPTILVFEDFRCRTLCGPALSIVASGIGESGLKPGRDFRLVSIGLNPRETPADARAFEASRLSADAALLQASDFLSGDAQSIAAAARSMGYGYAYDPAADQYTHPVAAFILAPDGRLTHVLPETALTGSDFRGAIKGADRGEVGDLVDRLALLCHGLVPLNGRYDGAVQTALRVAAVATVLAMAGGLVLMMRRRSA